MTFPFIKKLSSMVGITRKISLEEEVLKYVGQPYIIYSPKGDFLRGHPKVSEVLWNLGLSESDMKSRSALISGLKSQEMKNYDDAARQILQEQILLENATNFAGITEFEGTYILAQVKDAEAGSYVLFKDVTNDYVLLSSGARLSFDTSTMLGVLQNLPCGVLICDARDENFSSLCVNQSFLKIVSARGSDIQDKPLLEVLSRCFYHRDLYDLMCRFTDDPIPFSLDIERQDNEFYQWIRLSAHPVLNEVGMPIYFIVTVEDLTDVKTRQAQKNQSYKMEMLGQLSSGVAHDLNNVLAVVEGYAHLMRKDPSLEDQSVERVGYILDSVNKGASLIRQVMNYGRQGHMKPEVMNLGDAIYELKPLLKPLLNETITLSLDISGDVYVRCASDQIMQVVMNLVVNARDAMEETGGNLSIKLSVSEDSDEHCDAILSVQDDGCGMNEEVKNRIFDPYYTTKNDDKGTGLGMSTVQDLATKMNADIQIETQEGRGTKIVLTIPMLDEKPCTAFEQEDMPGTEHPLTGLTIMVVEDEEPVLDILGQVLKSYGAQVILARDGNKALEIQDEFEGDIDVLLTDIVLPELNGVHLSELFEFARPRTETIFFSGYPVSGNPLLKEVPDDMAFVSKPIEHSKLLQVITDKLKSKVSEPALNKKDMCEKVKPLHVMVKNTQGSQKTLYSMAGNAQDSGTH